MGFADNTLQTESTRVVSGRLPMANGCIDSNDSLPPPKYKRRRVSAIRDFPAGCGRPRIVVPVDMPIPAAPVVSSNPKDVKLSEFLPGQMIGEPKISCNGDVADSVDNRVPEMGNSCNGDVTTPGDNMTPCKFSALGNSYNGAVTVPVDNMVPCKFPPQYPPRRRISAIRHFPPFCGRNTTRIQESADVGASMEKKDLVLENLGVGEECMRGTVNATVKQTGENVQNGDVDKHQLERNFCSSYGMNVQAESVGKTTDDMSSRQDEFGASSEKDLNVTQHEFLEQRIHCSEESTQHQCDLKSEVVPESRKTSFESLKKFDFSKVASDWVIVVGLMASGNKSWAQKENAYKPCNLVAGVKESNLKKNDFVLPKQPRAPVVTKKNDVKHFGATSMKNKKMVVKKRSSYPSAKADQRMEFGVWNAEENPEHGGESNNFLLVRRSQNVDVTLPPSCPSSSSGKGDVNDSSVTRNKVRETLRLFQVVYRKLVKEDEAKLKHVKRPDCVAASVLKANAKYVNTDKIIGSVPGVEVGDEFQYRVELNIIGLHRPTQGGIDYVKEGGRILATSIVASGGYDDDMDDSDVLIYMGSGGNMMGGDKEPEDQKLERGNLALKNSVDAKNPVRVIRGDTKVSEQSNARTRTYIYDGLYLVENCLQEMGPHGKLVFKFKLVRIPGQPELAWKVVKKSKNFKVREGLCVDDISQGTEKIPICAVNTTDNEKPPSFDYVTHVVYPDWCRPIPPRGCDCRNGCSEITKCSCVAKNGGEIPYNHNGAIVEAKPLVYECGPSCKCPPSCYNRVAQHGIKFQLEIFKTESRGWGVRSLNSIPSGSFICEYVGELLEEKEAEQRAGNDEYLFDIGNNSNDLWDGLSNLISETHSSSCEVVEESCFTIDAAKCGNVGRFINHSCSPNLYAQNVLYDHEDKRIPHIMLFAAENIPPLQELTYHYNYTIDQVFDSDGNIKKKNCYCGSSECTGRMY